LEKWILRKQKNEKINKERKRNREKYIGLKKLRKKIERQKGKFRNKDKEEEK